MAGHLDVAKEAGVSLSTVFVYFPTRRALREAVFESMARWALEMATAAHRSGKPPREALYDHLARITELIEAKLEYARIWLEWSMATEDELWDRYRALQNRVFGMIKDTIRGGQRDGSIRADLAPEDGAIALVSAAYGIAQSKAAGRTRAELQRFARTVLDSVLPDGSPR